MGTELRYVLVCVALVGCAGGPVPDAGLAGEASALRVPTWLKERPSVEQAPAEPAPPRRRRADGFWFEGREEPRVRRPAPASHVNVREEVALEMDRVEAIRRGYRLYRRACATCHGHRADGNGPSAPGLATAPADLTSGMYMSTRGDDETVNEELYQILTDGIERDMPAWKKLLSPRDRWSIVAFLRTL